MDSVVEHVVDVGGRVAAIHLGDIAFRVIGVAVHRVVGHVACGVIAVATGRNVIIRGIDRWIEIIGSGDRRSNYQI